MGHDYADELQKRIETRMWRLKRLFLHLALTIVVAAALSVGIERGLVSRSLEGVIPAAVLLFVAHALVVMYQGARQFIIQQELQRELPEDYTEKPKRDEEDGELVDFEPMQANRRQ